MNWLTNFVKPKLSSLVKRRDVPEKLWNNCLSCGNMIHHKDLNNNLRVCPNCNYHFRMGAEDRINLLFNKNDYIEVSLDKITDVNIWNITLSYEEVQLWTNYDENHLVENKIVDWKTANWSLKGVQMDSVNKSEVCKDKKKEII